jgi:hypothetical protein
MHLEPLEKLPRSVREFLSHYAMIVLSILTALALEQVALRLEHRHEGARAKEEIEQEIVSNRRDVEQSLQATRQYKQDWTDLLKRTAAELKAGQSDNDTRLAVMREAQHRFGDAAPALKTTAWDAAVADHSVNYLDHADLTRYSQAYAVQRFFQQAIWDVTRDNAARTAADLTLPFFTGTADPVATLTLLNSRVRLLGIMESQLSQIDDALKATTAEATAPPASATNAAVAVSAASR